MFLLYALEKNHLFLSFYFKNYSKKIQEENNFSKLNQRQIEKGMISKKNA